MVEFEESGEEEDPQNVEDGESEDGDGEEEEESEDGEMLTDYFKNSNGIPIADILSEISQSLQTTNKILMKLGAVLSKK